MAENKTKENDASVDDFLNAVENDQKREDSYVILEMMKKITGLTPKMWGDSMVGFGSYHYKYISGREGDIFKCGFSPRKQYLSLYLFYGFQKHELMKKLGKYKAGKACLNIKKLDDVDVSILHSLVAITFHGVEKYNQICQNQVND